MSSRDWQRRPRDILLEMEESKKYVEYLIEKSRNERINRIKNKFSMAPFEEEYNNKIIKNDMCTVDIRRR